VRLTNFIKTPISQAPRSNPPAPPHQTSVLPFHLVFCIPYSLVQTINKKRIGFGAANVGPVLNRTLAGLAKVIVVKLLCQGIETFRNLQQTACVS